MNKTAAFVSGIVLAAALCAGSAEARAQSQPAASQPAATRPVEQVLLALKDGTRVQGTPLKADETEIVLQIGKTERTIPNSQVTPVGVYMARRALADLTKAETHIDLGNFLLRTGQAALAKREFEQSVQIDPSLAATVKPALDALSDTSSGTLALPPPIQIGKSASAPTSQEKPKFIPATAEEANTALQRAKDWAAEAKKFVPALHEVESPHFLIFSAKEGAEDRPLADLSERMYTALCKQFAIPPADNIYAGKCYMFVFKEKEQYRKFTGEVVKAASAVDAGGFCRNNGIEVYVILGPAKNSYWFNELLVHESTHGFVSRFQSTRHIPQWLNEGLAEYMAATLVPASHAAEKYLQAQRQAVHDKKDVAGVFEKVGLNEFDYGIAQSFVRYLITRDRLGFIKLVSLLKDGKSEADALKEAYGLTREDFLRDWRKAISQ